MAQTGYTPIQLYYSNTTTNAPLAANLANGELAINITDGKLFYKDNANVVQVIGWKVVPATAGGTGQTSYAVGDLLYANTTTTLAKLADVATGNALISGGVSTAPAWGKIGLTTHVSGTLPIANGGTNQTAFTSPASSIAALTYFDGTSLVNNATPSRLGFNATSNTFYANTQVTGSSNALIAGTSGFTPQNQTHAGDTNSSGFGVFAYTSGGVGRYQLNRSKSTTIGTNTALASGDAVGIIQYGAADGTGFIDCAAIRATVDGAVSTNVVPGRLSFYTNTGSSVNPVEQVKIDSSSNMTVLNGNVVIGTSGKGIDFSATAGTGTSELFADYEEGTFTPNLLFGGGNTGMTGSFTGRYTKIGRVVYYTAVIYLTAKGSSTGNTTISGFPYTSSASSTFYEGKADTDNVTGLAYQLVAQMSTSTTILNIYINVAGTLNNVTDASFANNSRFYVTGFYEA